MNEQTIQKGFLIAGGLLSLGLLGYLFLRGKEETIEEAEFTIVEDSKPKKTEQRDTIKKEVYVVKMKPIVSVKKEDDTIAARIEIPQEPNDDFPLKLGSKGEHVQQLQVYLLKNHGTAGFVNDEFNIITEERVIRFLKVKEVSKKLFQEKNMDTSKKKNNARKTKY